MKQIRYLILLMPIIFFSCEKDNENGMVTVLVKYNGKATTNPDVYMKKGTLTKPTGSFTWDKMQAGGEDGNATFENLPPGNYYFCAKAYGSSSYITGEVGVTVVARSRQNWYHPTIDAK